MALVFGFYQFYRRRELSLEAKDASQASRDASLRADEMARLVSFGHALTRFPDFNSVGAAAASHIPLLVPNRRVWVMIRARRVSGSRSSPSATRQPPIANAPHGTRWVRAACSWAAGRGRVLPDGDRRHADLRARRRVRAAAHRAPAQRAVDRRGAAGRRAEERGAVPGGAREQPAGRADRLLQPHARDRVAGRRAAPLAPHRSGRSRS